MAVLPPGVSAADFETAVNEFAAAVGADWIMTADADIELYRDPFSTVWDTEEEVLASGAVAPDSVEQVQAVVRIANRYRIPLFPISTGKNFAYGGPSPNLHGSLVVDLKRMDRILEVDADRNFALVEPGVSYFDLYRHIQERGLKVWIDCPDPGWGSPVGNSLDRGIGYTMPFYRDHIGANYGMEVVLANGEVMRTGMGAMPTAQTWQEYKYGFGPDPSGLFAQGNFGIVTKMGFRLMPQPENYRTGLITVPKRRDLIQMVKTLNYLSDSHLIGEPVFGSPLTALMGDAGFVAALNRRGGPDEAELDRYAADNDLHAWRVELQFYGPETTNRANWEYAVERFAREIPGSRAFEGESLSVPLTEQQLLNVDSPYPTSIRRNTTQGVPSLAIWKMLGRNANDPEANRQGHAGFIPIIPRSGEAIFEAQRVFAESMEAFDLPRFGSGLSTPVAWYPFAYQMGFVPATSRNDAEYNARVHRALIRMTEIAADHGWGDYRAPPVYQDHVANTYSFNDHVLRRFNETLKDAADPNGILAPGRGGVWPRNYREFRRV